MILHSLKLFNPLDSSVGQPCPAGWMILHSLKLFNPLDSCVGQPCPAGWMILHSLELLVFLAAVSGSYALQDG
jgi:hypothetical protein